MNTDPISDMLTRIRNAQKAGHAKLSLPNSRIKQRLAEILRDEGYLGAVQAEGEGPTRKLVIALKYDRERRGVIDGIERVSRPGLRVYRGYRDITPVRGGMGTSILSTCQGLMAEREAQAKKVGGEVLCNVW
jgi:small subunit ribosomal protein S8